MSDGKKWHAEAWMVPSDMGGWSIAGGGFVFPEDFLTDEAMKMEYGPLFVYLFRRFGPSEWGSDEYKSIADWFLTTPNPRVVLWVKPSVHGGEYSYLELTPVTSCLTPGGTRASGHSAFMIATRASSPKNAIVLSISRSLSISVVSARRISQSMSSSSSGLSTPLCASIAPNRVLVS